MVRILEPDDGFSSAASPTGGGIIAATAFGSYASDAAFVTAKGSAAANGDAYYNTTDGAIKLYRASAWEYFQQPAMTGTYALPQSIIAGTGIAFTGKQPSNIWFVKGSGGAVTVTANPQIAAPAYIGQMLRVFGCHATQTVKLSHGTGLSLLDADVILGDRDSILFLATDTSTWSEVERSS
jgi:hypothetical protein